MEDCIPVVNVIKSKEIIKVTEYFQRKFNAEPEFYIRVPGRVNLIGEHIDYCGYPVLPMALEQGVLLAVKPLDLPQIWLTNVDPKYPDWKGDIETSLKVGGNGSPQWYDYVLCGAKGASEEVLKNKKAYIANENGVKTESNGHASIKNVHGFMAVTSGSVPPAAGLSSSSALVCASALALIKANKLTMSKMEMAKLCATSERLIGTEGGGMDQAIAFLAEPGSAQHISWNPLRSQPIKLPDDAVFVVAHSLVEANKAATDHFNQRVKECKLAARLIAEDAGLECTDATLSEVHNMLGGDIEGMLARATRLPHLLHHLKPRDRATHVFLESSRVQKFTELCKTSNGDNDDQLNKLGSLMRQSHDSLRFLYECSHPALDQLVKLSDEFGVHARLTGAGWGGCIVALCPQSKASAFVDMLMNNFYNGHPAADKYDVKNLVFITKPHQGAQILINVI